MRKLWLLLFIALPLSAQFGNNAKKWMGLSLCPSMSTVSTNLWIPQWDSTNLCWKAAANGGASGSGLSSFTSPNSSVTIGGTLLDPTADINTTYTNGLYPQLGAGNTYTAGSKQSFNPSATTAGARIVPGAWFSAPIAGDQGVNAAGDFGTNDGVNNRFYFYINAADPNAPGLPTGTDLLLRPCEIVIGSLGTGSTALATDNTPVSLCDSPFTGSLKITEVKCYADSSTGAPAVEPKITGGAATSILTGPIACGNGAFGSAGTLNGSPVQTTDQSIDGVITTAGGTAKYIIIRIKRSL